MTIIGGGGGNGGRDDGGDGEDDGGDGSESGVSGCGECCGSGSGSGATVVMPMIGRNMTKSVDEPPVLSTARNAKEMLSRWRRPVTTAVDSLDFCIDASFEAEGRLETRREAHSWKEPERYSEDLT